MRSGKSVNRPARPRRPSAAGLRRGPVPRPADGVDAAALRRHADGAARLLRALGHRQRLQVLCLLADGELSVSRINEHMRLSQSALSQHLARMRADGLVATRRQAQTIFYRIASGPAHVLIAALHGIYCAAPGSAGQRSGRG